MQLRKSWKWCLSAVAILFAGGTAHADTQKLLPPAYGIYHGVFPDIPDTPFSGEVRQKVTAFERLAEKDAAWIILGNHWFNGINFPTQEVQEIQNMGKLPLLYIMPWSQRLRGVGRDVLYSLDLIINGQYDRDIRQYARAVKRTGKPVALSFAPEANGNWYPWSGVNYGDDRHTGWWDPTLADGPEKYIAAYQHIYNIFAQELVKNVTWVFQVTSVSKPAADWNSIAAYYPGDAYVDWIATSIYSAQEPGDFWSDFEGILADTYRELASLSRSKPIAIVEFATIEDAFRPRRKADWIANTLSALSSSRYPRIKGISYWHEGSWHESGLYNFRIDSTYAALDAYRTNIASNFFVETPIFSGQGDTPRNWCEEAGGRWFRQGSNNYCDCGSMWYEEDTIEYYGKQQFIANCRYYLQ